MAGPEVVYGGQASAAPEIRNGLGQAAGAGYGALEDLYYEPVPFDREMAQQATDEGTVIVTRIDGPGIDIQEKPGRLRCATQIVLDMEESAQAVDVDDLVRRA